MPLDEPFVGRFPSFQAKHLEQRTLLSGSDSLQRAHSQLSSQSSERVVMSQSLSLPLDDPFVGRFPSFQAKHLEQRTLLSGSDSLQRTHSQLSSQSSERVVMMSDSFAAFGASGELLGDLLVPVGLEALFLLSLLLHVSVVDGSPGRVDSVFSSFQ